MKMTQKISILSSTTLSLFFWLGALSGCGSSSDTCEGAPVSTSEPLQWKRMDAVTADLGQALALGTAELCSELARFDCTDIHRVSLGASNPFGSGLYEPLPRPLTTTSTALDRVILSACSRRADSDAQGTPVVFTHFPLTGDAPAPGSAPAAALVKDLYHRLLQRDATADEIAAVSALAVDDASRPVSGRDFASLACFAIATTTEFLFF